MSSWWQWVVVSVILAGAVVYTAWRMGLLAWLRLAPPPGGMCGNCDGCSAVQRIAERLAADEPGRE